MCYPMPQLAFTECLILLEIFLAYKVMYHTTFNHSSKLSTMQADWYN